MCGIIGYTGLQKALPHLLAGLEALEYRGYDSAGVTLSHPSTGAFITVRAGGKLDRLKERLKTHPDATLSQCGIGHTRWATHGAPDSKNAHPHTAAHLSLVHNGIIENDGELRAEVLSRGITLLSETDTEVAAWVIDGIYAATGDPVAALFAATARMRGSFAFALLFYDRPGEIYAIRRDSPLIVAQTSHGTVLASDIPAVLRHAREYIRPPQDTVICLRAGGISMTDRDGTPVTPVTERAEADPIRAQKGGYDHFMRKEIDEQPEALRQTLTPRIQGNLLHFGIAALDTDDILRFRRIHLIACGTAMHAGLIGKRTIEELARLPALVEIASEFRYRDPLLDPAHDLCILLSQSGETADTLAALRYAKTRGVTTLAIVNAVGSSVAREADHVLYTWAGPEIAVASTKAYSVQCALLTLLALRLAHANGRMTRVE
ncbi:MAG: glutamine--fructose-6-phosphate transaminase (isomerizing), partial [Clostridia bacterium]|nr:glutamine--fructose-6-phosphate transaminase (isomerizing) [Clostridia bacterium]